MDVPNDNQAITTYLRAVGDLLVDWGHVFQGLPQMLSAASDDEIVHLKVAALYDLYQDAGDITAPPRCRAVQATLLVALRTDLRNVLGWRWNTDTQGQHELFLEHQRRHAELYNLLLALQRCI